MRALVVFAALALSTGARAQDWQDVAWFAGGAATAFVAHEAGHATANLALGNTPHLEPVKFLGVVPFFAISPQISCGADACFRANGDTFGAGRRGLLVILQAGFNVQHLTDEAVLTLDPHVRTHAAPFRTGLLAFNTLTSIAYATANLVGAEPNAGDIYSAVRDTRVSRGLTTGLLLGIAGVDIARWAEPDVAWLAWVSRGAKVVFLGLPVSI